MACVKELLAVVADGFGVNPEELLNTDLYSLIDLIPKTFSSNDKSVHFSVDILADMWGCSKRAVYDAIKHGELDAFKVGKEWRITESARREFERNRTRKEKLRRGLA